MKLRIQITRTSPTHHRLQYIREDGSGESSEIESKSFLEHDFLHFALESEAKISSGFFGLLGVGHTLAELKNTRSPSFEYDTAMQVERAVGALTGIIKGATTEQVMESLRTLYDAEKRDVPTWLSQNLLAQAAKRYRALIGEWNSLKFGETLNLQFKV